MSTRKWQPWRLVLVLGLVGCKAQSGSGITQKDLVGTWQTVDTEVRLPSMNGTRKDSTFSLDAATRLAETNTQAPLTTLAVDGTYRDEVRDGEGKVVMANKGTWFLQETTLIIRLTSQGNGERKFQVRKKGRDQLQLKNFVDWDMDGEEDDVLTVQLKRQ